MDVESNRETIILILPRNTSSKHKSNFKDLILRTQGQADHLYELGKMTSELVHVIEMTNHDVKC